MRFGDDAGSLKASCLLCKSRVVMLLEDRRAHCPRVALIVRQPCSLLRCLQLSCCELSTDS